MADGALATEEAKQKDANDVQENACPKGCLVIEALACQIEMGAASFRNS